MAPSAPPSLYSSWFEYWKQNLQSSPGRVGSALRIVLTAVLVLITMMVLQIPYIAYALYVIFIVTNESPAVSLRTGTASLLSVAAVLAITLIVVIATDNDPMARVLGLAIITFLGGMIAVATSMAAMGPICGLICAVATGLWENHFPADAVVKDSLWLLAAIATGIGETVAIAYVLRSRSPADKLGEELRTRYRALAAMFEACAGGSTEQQRRAAADHVSRLPQPGIGECWDCITRSSIATLKPVASRRDSKSIYSCFQNYWTVPQLMVCRRKPWTPTSNFVVDLSRDSV